MDGDRRDWYLAAGVSLWIERVVHDALRLELRYEYERNHSNDRYERYESHNPGVYLHWSY